MKIQRKWRPGGRPRKSNSTKKWLQQQQDLLIGGNDAERLITEPPLVLPKRLRKGA